MPVTSARRTGWTRLRNALESRITTREYLASRSDPASSVVMRFLAGLRNANGVWKTTARHRLHDVLPAVVRALGAPGTQVRALDVGCSSGLSTLELSECLVSHGFAADVFGTDLSLTASFVSDERGRGMLFLDRTHVAQVELEGWALGWPPAASERILHPIRVARVRTFLASSLPHYLEGAREGGASPVGDAGRVDRGDRVDRVVGRDSGSGRAGQVGHADRVGRVERVDRVDRVELTRRHVPLTVPVPPGTPVRFVQESALEPALAGRFHAVLAANFLNLNYFPADFLTRAVSLLRGRLVQDGVLCIVRTLENGDNHGTVFRMTASGPVVLERIGRGSEIEQIVLSSPPPG